MSASLTNTIWFSNHPDGFVLAGKNCLCSYKGTPSGTITIPSNITCAGLSCFSSKQSNFSIVLNDLLTIIPQGCFYGCYNLQSINLQNVKKIGRQSFSNCASLKKIILSRIVLIREYAFASCNSLKYVYIDNNIVPNIGEYPFENTTCNFYVLDSLVDSYKIATNWSTYADRILPISQFTTDFPNG